MAAVLGRLEITRFPKGGSGMLRREHDTLSHQRLWWLPVMKGNSLLLQGFQNQPAHDFWALALRKPII